MVSFSCVFAFVSPVLCDVDDFVLENNLRVIWSCSFAGLAVNMSTYKFLWYSLEKNITHFFITLLKRCILLKKKLKMHIKDLSYSPVSFLHDST